jgi:hypothetical protein
VSQILNCLTNFNHISRLHQKTTGPEKPKGNGGTPGAQYTEQDIKQTIRDVAFQGHIGLSALYLDSTRQIFLLSFSPFY